MNNKTNKITNTAIHILTWVGLCMFPYFVGFSINGEFPNFDLRALIMPTQIMLMFYLNYMFLINRLLFRQRVWQFVGVNFLIVISVSLLIALIMNLFPPEQHDRMRGHEDIMRNIFPVVVNLTIQAMVVGVSVAIKMTGKLYEVRERLQELEKANAQAELQQLKSQLNPHFLFNSLNNIYALIAFDPDKAQLSLHSLCDMLRYQLYEANRETIPLEKEIEFVRSYCDLMRLRLPRHVELSVDLPGNCERINIAPLLFVSVIENAFKHGISPGGESRIAVKIAIESGYIVCHVRNSYHPKTDSDRSGSGIGLENLRRRLELLYPCAHSFVAERIGNEFTVQLTIKTTA